MAAGVAQVDAVQAQQGKPRGVGFGRTTMVAFEGFVQVIAAGQGGITLHLPVVEVAGNDHRRIIRQGLEELTEQLQLQLTMAFQQAEVNADRMHFAMPRHVQHAVQQATAFRAGNGNIQVSILADRIFRQQGIAMVTVGIDGIAPIGEVAPHAVGKEFILRGLWPIVVAGGVAVVLADDFLQEHQVCRRTAHRFTQFRKDEAPVECGKTLMGVDRQHAKPMNRRGCVQRR
ncbi:hypothetical protein D3C87_1157720 [compost metagenome]